MTPDALAVERDRLLEGGRTLEQVERMQRAADGRIEAAVLAVDAALRPIGGHGPQGYWRARGFIREQGGYDGDLNDLAVLAEVTRLVAAPLWLALPPGDLPIAPPVCSLCHVHPCACDPEHYSQADEESQ